MLDDNAFLRRLPVVLDGAQTVQLEALVFSADAIEASLEAIRRITTEHRWKICEASRRVHVELFIHAWTIVDCLHVVGQVLKAMDFQTPRAVAFQEKYECARKLRNKMDHLSENALNVAASKARPPVFGALGYVCVPDENMIEENGQIKVTGGGMVIISTGRFAGGQKIGAVNPAGLEMHGPVSGFRLEAFDEALKLEDAEKDLRALMIEVNDRLENIASNVSMRCRRSTTNRLRS